MIASNKKKKVDINKRFFNAILTDQTMVPNLILRHYKDFGLNAQECIALLHILAGHPKSAPCFSCQDIIDYLEGDEDLAQNEIQLLLEKGFLTVTEGQASYSLEACQDKMKELWAFLNACPKQGMIGEPKVPAPGKPSAALAQVCMAFERELGRPLSPVEGEKITAWLEQDGWSAPLLQEALKRAVLYGNCNFAYIGRILESWYKKGIRTLEAAMAESKNTGHGKSGAPKKKSSGNDYDTLLNR